MAKKWIHAFSIAPLHLKSSAPTWLSATNGANLTLTNSLLRTVTSYSNSTYTIRRAWIKVDWASLPNDYSTLYCNFWMHWYSVVLSTYQGSSIRHDETITAAGAPTISDWAKLGVPSGGLGMGYDKSYIYPKTLTGNVDAMSTVSKTYPWYILKDTYDTGGGAPTTATTDAEALGFAILSYYSTTNDDIVKRYFGPTVVGDSGILAVGGSNVLNLGLISLSSAMAGAGAGYNLFVSGGGQYSVVVKIFTCIYGTKSAVWATATKQVTVTNGVDTMSAVMQIGVHSVSPDAVYLVEIHAIDGSGNDVYQTFVGSTVDAAVTTDYKVTVSIPYQTSDDGKGNTAMIVQSSTPNSWATWEKPADGVAHRNCPVMFGAGF